MDENKKVLIDVKMNASEALKELATAKIRIEELREAQKKLDKSTEEGRQEYEAYGAEIKRQNSIAQSYQKEIANTIKRQQSAQGSLERLKTELSLNTAAYNKLSEAERNSAKGEDFAATIIDTTQRLKDAEEELGNFHRSVGDYAKAGMSLRTEIRQLTEALTQMKMAGQEGSAEYREMSARASELNDAMGDVQQQTRGLASDTQKLDVATQSISGLIGAFGAYQSVIGATIDDDSELANVMKNLQIVMAALVSLKTIQNVIQKQSIVYLSAEIALRKIGIDQTARAAVAEVALNTAKSSGNIITKTLSLATWAWNAALASNPVVLIGMAVVAFIGIGYKLIKMFDATAVATKAAEKANAEYEKQVQKTQDTIDSINRKLDDNTKKTEIRGRSEILELKKNGASKEEISRREAQMAQELRDIEINASKDREKAKREELAKSQTVVEKEKELLVALAKRHGEGSEKYKEQLDKVNDLVRAKNELVGVIKQEINAQKDVDLKSAESAQADKEAKADKYKESYMKRLDLQQKFSEAQLASEKKYHNDSTKTDTENAALRFQHEQIYEARMFDLKQKSEQTKLEAQRKFGVITNAEYAKQIELLQLSQKVFDNTQADKTAEFFEGRRKEIVGMIEKDAATQIKDIQANYSQAMNDLNNDPELSGNEKAFYRLGLEKEQGKQIAQVKEQQQAQINAMLEVKYKDDLAKYSDNEREKLRLEMEITEEAIAQKQAAGLSTADDEAKLLAQKMQMNQIQLNSDLLQTQNNLDAQYQLKKDALDRELEINKDNADKIAEINAEQADLDREYTEAKIANIEEWAGKGMELLGAMNEFSNVLGQVEVQRAEESNARQKSALDARLKSGKISQQQYDKDVAKLDSDLDKKKAEIARKQAVREKVFSITQAIIRTALAVLNGLNTQPFLPLGPIMAASAAALGAVQIATIVATPLPKARKGGRIVGNSHEGGGVLIEAEGGEQVVNKYAMAAFPELVNLLNAIGNTGGKMPDGGYAARAMMRESTAINGNRRSVENTAATRHQSAQLNGSLDSDAVVDKLNELNETIRNLKIYTSIDDIRKADKRYTYIEQMAKI